MPVKRRTPKGRIHYPETIERLIAGEEIERSDDAHCALVGLIYFGDHPELAERLRQRASNVLQRWLDANA